MPAISDIVVNDGQATPVAHTFEPAKTTADYALWEDRDAGIYVGNKKLTMTLSRPQGNGLVGNRNLKLSIKLEIPRLEALGTSSSGITPAPTVAYRLVGEMHFTFPERSTAAERKDMRTFYLGLLTKAPVVDAIEKLALPY